MALVSIQASVGRTNGVKNCYNVPVDRDKVRGLLNAIPASSGGAGGSLALETGLWGTVSDELYRAILTFQRFHAAAEHLSIDGHVDPHEKTLALLNALAGRSTAPSISSTPPPASTIVALAPKLLASAKLNELSRADRKYITVDVPGTFTVNFTLTSFLPGTEVRIKIAAGPPFSASKTALLTPGVRTGTLPFGATAPTGHLSVLVDLQADGTIPTPVLVPMPVISVALSALGVSGPGRVPAPLYSVEFKIIG